MELKRHDTQPSFIVTVSDCNGPLDLTNCITEVSMWARANLKKTIDVTDTYFALARNVGFQQSLVGDIIVMDRVRDPEQMLVIGHDELNHLVQVQRGYNGTPVSCYKRGTPLRIFRILNAVGSTDMVYQKIDQLDGNSQNVLTESQLIYTWQPNDTCLPGCYWLEFKLLNMLTDGWLDPLAQPPGISFIPRPCGTAGDGSDGCGGSITPIFTKTTTVGCGIGNGVSWVRRFPSGSDDGFYIKINNTNTAETLS